MKEKIQRIKEFPGEGGRLSSFFPKNNEVCNQKKCGNDEAIKAAALEFVELINSKKLEICGMYLNFNV